MKYARTVDGIVQEVIDFDPTVAFHEDVAALFVQCGETVVPGWTYNGKTFKAPAPVPTPLPTPAPAPVLPSMTPMQFYLAFTVAERRAIKASTNPDVQEFWATFQLLLAKDVPIDPNLPSVTSALEGMVLLKLITADRVAAIQAGVAQ